MIISLNFFSFLYRATTRDSPQMDPPLDTNTPIHQTISFNIYSLIAAVFISLSTVSLVSSLVPRMIGYVILGIAWISVTTFLSLSIKMADWELVQRNNMLPQLPLHEVAKSSIKYLVTVWYGLFKSYKYLFNHISTF